MKIELILKRRIILSDENYLYEIAHINDFYWIKKIRKYSNEYETIFEGNINELIFYLIICMRISEVKND